MDLETTDRITRHLAAAEQERLAHIPAPQETGPPEARLHMLFARFDELKSTIGVSIERSGSEELRVAGTTPAGRFAEIRLQRYFTELDPEQPRRYYGIDAEVLCGGFTATVESINEQSLAAQDAARVSLELANLEETFAAAAAFVGNGFTVTSRPRR